MTKRILVGVACAVMVLGAGLLWLSSNVDTLVKAAITDYGSKMTRSSVSVGAVKISASDGRGSISQLRIANPPGFKTPHAIQVAQVDLEIDIASLTQDIVVIRRLAVQAPDLIYEKGEKETNFDALANHIAGVIDPQVAKADKTAGKKMVIDLLTVQGATVQLSAPFMAGNTVSVALPDITLKNIGRARGGVTPAELGQEVANALRTRLKASTSFERLLQPGSAAIDQVGSGIKGLFK